MFPPQSTPSKRPKRRVESYRIYKRPYSACSQSSRPSPSSYEKATHGRLVGPTLSTPRGDKYYNQYRPLCEVCPRDRGKVVGTLQGHYVALSQEKSEEIWRKRTRGSGGDGSGAGTSGVSSSPMEEFPTLQDLISLEDLDVPPLWGSADFPEKSATETVTKQDPSAITVTVLTNQSPALPGPSTAPFAEPVSPLGSPSCDAASSASSHSIECEGVVKALHEVKDEARAVVGLGEVVRDSFLTFNNIMSTKNKILDKLNQNVEKLSRRNISDERGGETQKISVKVTSSEVALALRYTCISPLRFRDIEIRINILFIFFIYVKRFLYIDLHIKR